MRGAAQELKCAAAPVAAAPRFKPNDSGFREGSYCAAGAAVFVRSNAARPSRSIEFGTAVAYAGPNKERKPRYESTV